MIALLIYCELNPLMAKARLIRKNIDLKLTRSIGATAASIAWYRLDHNRDFGRPKSEFWSFGTPWCGGKEGNRVGKAQGRNY